MEESPYKVLLAAVLEEIRGAVAPQWRTGKVKSASPLVVDCGGLPLQGADLLLDERLKGRLLAGDRVAMLAPPGEGQFIILCKVVS